MASNISTGSPTLSKKRSAFKILDQDGSADQGDFTAPKSGNTASRVSSAPLESSKFANLQPKISAIASTEADKDNSSPLNDILARLRLNDPKQNAVAASTEKAEPAVSQSATNKIFHNLNEQNQAMNKQRMELLDESGSDRPSPREAEHSSGSDLFTPATESFDVITNEDAGIKTSNHTEAAEMLRVKQELAAAKNKLYRQEQELAEAKKLKHTMDQAMGAPSEADFGNDNDISETTIGHLQSAFNASARPFQSRTHTWQPQEDASSDNSDILSAGAYNRTRGIWNNPAQQQAFAASLGAGPQPPPYIDPRPQYNPDLGTFGGQAFSSPYGNQRVFSNDSGPNYGFESRYGNDHTQYGQYGQPGGLRRNMNQYNQYNQYNRAGSGFSNRSSAFGSYASQGTTLGAPSISAMSMSGPMGYTPRPIGSPLSPTFPEYGAGSMPTIGGQWPPISTVGSVSSGPQTYVSTLEPVNYRRLLDKTVSCDWKNIVDKIVCNNDQQASIFLQQKLKVGTAEQKYEIVESIVNQAYPLMINRFGNFLVQRCFEHGTPDQVVAIANAIHGNVLSLSMDAFGCHVIQKAFDSVPEQHKADMVRELLRRIPDTVIHRYACHVWQKLFELRWSGEPPQIMLKVNEALRGMWHEVALGETGSLVVQNIFENCVEEEKRPAIEEVIANIDLIAHGQFGNWCIQHICEHGAPPDKRRVVDHLLANAYSYSVDQFASKVVEKCLKIGGVEFMDRYLGVITTAHPDRPRIPLVDISGDQYGNYLIQWILMNTHHHQRESVASHIRKHMVSLRGSKFGSRVAMLCCNPASITRPGPGVVVNPYGAPGQPRPWGGRRF